MHIVLYIIGLYYGYIEMTETELRLEYVERTWNIEFSGSIEEAIENDYVKNSFLYTDEIFAQIQMALLLCPQISPDELIILIHSFENAKQSS